MNDKPFECGQCGAAYGSAQAANRCAIDDERVPRKRDWLDPGNWG